MNIKDIVTRKQAVEFRVTDIKNEYKFNYVEIPLDYLDKNVIDMRERLAICLYLTKINSKLILIIADYIKPDAKGIAFEWKLGLHIFKNFKEEYKQINSDNWYEYFQLFINILDIAHICKYGLR